MNNKISFIGLGNMGGAMVKRLAEAEIPAHSDIYVYDTDKEKMCDLIEKTSVIAVKSATEAAEKSDFIFISVKPGVCETVLSEIKSVVEGKIVISIAAGLDISFFKNILGENIKVVRTMPNTPAQIGEGVSLISGDDLVLDDELAMVKSFFECFGETVFLPENLINKAMAITSSSPAYIFILIEAMAGAAVRLGIPADMAYRMAAQAVKGSAGLMLETGKHPAELRDAVCSPGGTTIEAVAKLEELGFRNAVIDAIKVCADKADAILK